MSSLLISFGLNVIGKAYHIATYGSAATAVYNVPSYLVKTIYNPIQKHATKTFSDFFANIDDLTIVEPVPNDPANNNPANIVPVPIDEGYEEICEATTRYEVCHTKVGDRNFSVITVIAHNQPSFNIHHAIVKDHIMEYKQVLTALKAPFWKSNSWVFDPTGFGAPDQIFDTSFSMSNTTDADNRSDIYCFTVGKLKHAFSLILTRSVLDVSFGVCTGDIRSKIGKVTKLDPQTDSGFVKLSANIGPWWTVPTPLAPSTP